jgi:hypothetical protein
MPSDMNIKLNNQVAQVSELRPDLRRMLNWEFHVSACQFSSEKTIIHNRSRLRILNIGVGFWRTTLQRIVMRAVVCPYSQPGVALVGGVDR